MKIINFFIFFLFAISFSIFFTTCTPMEGDAETVFNEMLEKNGGNVKASTLVLVGEQAGLMAPGSSDSVTFSVTTANITDGVYSAVVANLPPGVSVSGDVTIAANKGILTLTGSESTVIGVYANLTLTINGFSSGVFTLTISEKTISVGAQTGTMSAGNSGQQVSFAVMTTNIVNGSYTATVSNLPPGVTVYGQVNIDLSGAGLLILAGNAETAAGAYSGLILTIGNVNSGTFTLIIKSVIVGMQSDHIVAGIAGNIIFPVETAQIESGQAGSVSWWTNINGNVSASVPAGISAAVTSVDTDAATVMINATNATKIGQYYFRVLINGVQSAVATLSISGDKTVTVGIQNGTLTAGISGSVTFPVATTNIASGPYTALLSNSPAGIIVFGQVNIDTSGTGTLTLNGNTGTAGGTYNNLTITIDNIASLAFTLTIAPRPVSLNAVTPNGSSTQSTTQLTLTFSESITGLTAAHIGVVNGTGEVTKGTLSGSGVTWTLNVTTSKAGNITVSVLSSPSGYSLSGSHSISVSYVTSITLNSVVPDGSSAQTTTQLTLNFSQMISGLDANDINLSGVSGIQKGILEGSGPSYILPISGFTAGGSLSVSVTKSGYTISGTPKSVTIYYVAATLVSVTANGSLTQTSTELTITFDKAVSGLLAADITLSGVTGASNITKTLDGTGPVYILTIANVSAGGTLSVAVSKIGYTIAGSPKTATIFYAVPVTLNSVSANGTSTQTTTQLTLTFDKAISGLSAADISIERVSNVQKGSLGGSGPTYTLPISNFTANGTLSVSVRKDGFNISGSPKSAAIYYAAPVTLTNVTPNGSPTTTSLTLTFNASISGLTASNISISDGTGSATRGTLSGSGTSWTLNVNTTKAGTVTVSVSGVSGYSITGAFTPTLSYAVAVTFNSVSANNPTGTTTQLTLGFSAAIAGLSAGDITLTPPSGTTISKSTLSGSGPSYTLDVTTGGQNGSVTVAVAKEGFSITNPSRTVNVTVALGGSVSISGQTYVNATLSADISLASPNTSLKYQWTQNGNNISGATESTYKVSTSYRNAAIRVVVTRDTHAGNLTSNAITMDSTFYGVFSREDLAAIGDSSTTRTRSHKLLNNINLGGSGNPWTPINLDSGGVLDGNGYIISGLYISSAVQRLGLIGLNTGTIRNLGLTGISITRTGSSGLQDCAGGIAAWNNVNGVIEQCFVTGDITSSSTATVMSEGGGIAARNVGVVRNCYSAVNVTINESIGDAGGIVGNNNNKVEYCYSTGIIKGNNMTGGISGAHSDSSYSINYCVALNKSITGAYGGRIAGHNDYGTYSNNCARNDMTISGWTVTNPAANGKDGAAQTVGSAPMSTVFSGWDSSVWNIPGGNLVLNSALPTLKSVTQSPAPVLP